MKKTTKKLLTAFMLLSILFSAFALVCAAEEQTDKVFANNDLQNEDKSEDKPEDTAESPFALAFDCIKSYATEIFCALTLVCSLALSFAYKKGLIPAVKAALSALSGTVKKIEATQEGATREGGEMLSALTERLDGFAEGVKEISERLNSLDTELSALGEGECDRERQRLILLGQTEMLYSVFMSSSLPQYQKDEISRRVAAMKELLGDGSEE